MSHNSQRMAECIVKAVDEKKGLDVIIIDLESISPIADYFIVATGQTDRHVKAIIDEVKKVAIDEDLKLYSLEGEKSGSWVLMDYGVVVVHVFQPEYREYYQLESLWADATQFNMASFVNKAL